MIEIANPENDQYVEVGKPVRSFDLHGKNLAINTGDEIQLWKNGTDLSFEKTEIIDCDDRDCHMKMFSEKLVVAEKTELAFYGMGDMSEIDVIHESPAFDVKTLDFSPCGRIMVTTSSDTIRIYD